MKNDTNTHTTREAVGIFFDAKTLEDTITDLKASGFLADELGLLASEFAVRENLGHLYTDVNEHGGSEDAPETAFVSKGSTNEISHAMFGSLYIIGTAVVGGAVVASAGILGGGVAVAVATTAVFGGVAAVLGGILHKSDADYLEEQVDEGHLLLFVTTKDSEHEKKAVEIMSKHSAFDPRIHTVSGTSAK